MSTTAVVGVSALAASAVAMPLQSRDEEGTPVLSAAIKASFEGGFANNSAANDDVNRDSGLVAGRWTDIYFNGEMTADNGLTYGAQIRLAAGGGGNANNIDLLGHSGLGRQYLYVKGSWGSLEAGTWIGAATALNLNVAGQYKGNGGLDFSYKSYIVQPDPTAISHIQNPHWWDAGETKITYYTPVFNGFQAGVTYTPTDSPWGTATTGLAAGDGQAKDVISYGAQWKGDMGGSTVTVSAVGAMSDDSVQNPQPMTSHRHVDGMVEDITYMTPGATRHGIEMFQISGMVAHAGFTTGATFWDYGDTGMLPGDSQDYSGWALDATYSFGPYGIEISYAHAERMTTAAGDFDNTFNGWALQIGYAVAPGLKWYADLVGAEWEYTKDGMNKTDDSTVVLTGVNVNF